MGKRSKRTVSERMLVLLAQDAVRNWRSIPAKVEAFKANVGATPAAVQAFESMLRGSSVREVYEASKKFLAEYDDEGIVEVMRTGGRTFEA
jgi:hypothetical protein